MFPPSGSGSRKGTDLADSGKGNPGVPRPTGLPALLPVLIPLLSAALAASSGNIRPKSPLRLPPPLTVLGGRAMLAL